MKEFTCIVCGTKGIDWGRGHAKKFCSRQCQNYHKTLRKERHDKIENCKHNAWVACDKQECENCGWNPVVEKKRKEALV